MMYEQWLKLVEENSVLTREKLKLEAKVAETQKYAKEKEEEASQARLQLEEAHKNVRMLNNGTKQLDHILNIDKTDRYGLGFKGNLSNQIQCLSLVVIRESYIKGEKNLAKRRI